MDDGTAIHRKVTAGALGGAASTVLVFLLSLVVDVPAGTASAFTTLCTFACGYFTSSD